ncbi:MAG: hypothetical protein Q7K98_06665 [Candidatus Omnitrophota bacterium]|nr:hypothetical protein [Candidatus Omnitrophota bacterium]
MNKKEVRNFLTAVNYWPINKIKGWEGPIMIKHTNKNEMKDKDSGGHNT